MNFLRCCIRSCNILAGAECSTQKGTSKAFDHNALVHQIWTFALAHGIKLWVERVPTKENIADDPSRFHYKLLDDLKARWKQPYMCDRFKNAVHAPCELYVA